jgi:glycosyltransferase involved in cell wall biosynthesis
MKVLVNCHVPFSFAHGGMQIQIERTMSALSQAGVEVEPLRWWDETQTGDLLHHFSRIPTTLLMSAQQKGIKVVFADLLGGLGARSSRKLWLQRITTRTLQRALSPNKLLALGWESYRLADACIALTPWEAHLMSYVFGATPEKVHVVPNGVEEIFLNSPRMQRGQWLVCVGTIAAVKRMVELAQAAILAQTPLWVIGKAYSESDPYAQEFFRLARENPKIIRYEGPVNDRAKVAEIYRQARGFVLLSRWESLSLSALEAAACECPLLLSDLPWARTTFKNGASYCPNSSPSATAPFLKSFYDSAPVLQPPPKPLTWLDIAKQLKSIYEDLLRA